MNPRCMNQKTAPLIGGVLLVHAASMTLEGCLFSLGDAKMVATIYGKTHTHTCAYAHEPFAGTQASDRPHVPIF